ncbi:protein LTV1 homolog [Mangifera indica]|uniref:protein LTV1 homolog n=1 Tax=Mangifera indica TaxID=29780 RepID=UPI001CF96F8B|nr:protein LTV1 homolog [Mangifera indica]
MGKKKKFIDKKKAATFQLLARDSSDPYFDDTPGNDRVFVRLDNNPYSLDVLEENHDDSNSIFADAAEDDGDDELEIRGASTASLPEHIRREILELGFPDDGYNYLTHLREIKNTGGGSAFYHNPKFRLDQLPRDVKAYDASRVQISQVKSEANDNSIYSVASKTFGVRVPKAIDPEVDALLDDSDLSRFGSDVEDLEEDFIVQANYSEEVADLEIDKKLNLVDESKVVTKDDSVSFFHQENVVGERKSALEEEENDFVADKPRVRRLLDEQFDLLECQEYGTDSDDDYGGYDVEEEESLANKLKSVLTDRVAEDFELYDKYEAPADILHVNDIPKGKEAQDSAADIIRRCVEYAEKYENESENEDDKVVVQESSDELEEWDCETIITTYSNLDNHPGKIGAPEIARKKKLAETVSAALNANNHVISLKGKEKLPVEFLPHGQKAATEKMKVMGSLKSEQLKRKQHGQESKEEKKERKTAVKQERREARQAKKEMKGLYRGEAQRAQKVAAISGPSSIRLM